MTEQWKELKETIAELRDNNGTATQQEVCAFLANLMDELERQMNCSEIPNNSDTIIRQAAIRIASGYCHPANIAAELSKLPSVRPKQRWIPVSERLPERSGEYLVSVIDGSGDDIDYEAVGVAWFAHKKDYNIKESEWRELRIDEIVIAWMPLPEPHREEGEAEYE